MDLQIREKSFNVPNKVITLLEYLNQNTVYNTEMNLMNSKLYRFLSNEEAINYQKYLRTHVVWLSMCVTEYTRDLGVYLAATYLEADELSILRAIDKIEMECTPQ